MNDEDIDVRKLGLKVRSDPGVIPEEFESTGIPDALEAALLPDYIPASTGMPGVNRS